MSCPKGVPDVLNAVAIDCCIPEQQKDRWRLDNWWLRSTISCENKMPRDFVTSRTKTSDTLSKSSCHDATDCEHGLQILS
mmetsp:Transcript_144652/g.266775  ORF Transcript_144652/g.266775 Transcript_144652/m.266775 type:complete len:80 (-) Transcript_144652:129-368(-)